MEKIKIDKRRIVWFLKDLSWESKKVIEKQELIIKQIEQLKTTLENVDEFVKFNDRGEIIIGKN